MVRKSDEEQIKEFRLIEAEIYTAVSSVIIKSVFKEMDPQIDAVFTALFLFPIVSQLYKAFFKSENKQEFYGHVLTPVIYFFVANFFINTNFADTLNGMGHLFDSIKQMPAQHASPAVATEAMQQVVVPTQELSAKAFSIIEESTVLRDAINAPLVAREQAITWAKLGESIISWIQTHPKELIFFIAIGPVVAASRKYWNKFRDTFDVTLEIRRKGDEKPHAVPTETLPAIARLQREFGGDD